MAAVFGSGEGSLAMNFTYPIKDAEGNLLGVWTNRFNWEVARTIFSEVLARTVADGAESVQLTLLTRDGTVLEFAGSVRTRWTDPQGRGMAGFEFAEGQYDARARLALALFGATARTAASALATSASR